MTVGFFSPLPPARTGVADYSAALLNALRARVTVKIDEDGDINLYHLGNNQLHARIYEHALRRPGVIVLHDAVLNHFALGYFTRDAYIQEFTYNYGPWSHDLADSLWSTRGRSAGDWQFFRYPMLKRIVEQSQKIIVHNPAAAAIVLRHCPTAHVVEIPHLYAQPALPHIAEVEAFRRRLTTHRCPLFGVFGHLRESKRIHLLLRTFSKTPERTLLLAGDMNSRELRRAAEPYLALPNIRRIGYMDSRTYWSAALAVDACINLRYPAAGETSGVSIGFMGAGRPVLMTDSFENSRYREGTCVKISAGVSEAAELEACLDWMASHPAYAREIGMHAAAYIREHHALDHVAAQYIQTLTVH